MMVYQSTNVENRGLGNVKTMAKHTKACHVEEKFN